VSRESGDSIAFLSCCAVEPNCVSSCVSQAGDIVTRLTDTRGNLGNYPSQRESNQFVSVCCNYIVGGRHQWSKLRSIEKQIYRCHALKYIVENMDTWQLLLMPGRTNENERRALNRIMQKYTPVKDPIWRRDRYIVVREKIRHLSHTMNVHLNLKRVPWWICRDYDIPDPEL